MKVRDLTQKGTSGKQAHSIVKDLLKRGLSKDNVKSVKLKIKFDSKRGKS